ncbi:patatin-like phospholipase family protein [Mangrovivirga sp. M17]|uniref:Patatin-like phospholipase family protein n=1 Tax=Mangrovivirga halotolerans TaxID=2993936 RepID=A0ABT3RY25_9BACT|nr:patatin-like phospholipase family protein [Mangrovivirga halotolerans]MCX2746035.1 patatin-like phospholipase family protein [Mangrovivirga halotolerans]
MKRALITSGGGAKGAFSVGALSYIFNNNLGDFDIISGTSTGSLIAVFAAIGDIETLKDVYTNVVNDDIIARTNLVRQLQQGEPYLLDTYPLKELINEKVTDDVFLQVMNSNTTLCLTAVSLQTGKPYIFTTKNIIVPEGYEMKMIQSLSDLKDAMLASSSQGGFLPPVNIDGHQMVDGGHWTVVPSAAAVAQNPDEIIVLSNNPRELSPGEPQYTSVINTIMRVISIFLQGVKTKDYMVLEDYVARTNNRVFNIEPDTNLDEENPTGLRFDRFLMTLWRSQGEQKAKEVFTESSNEGGLVT